MFLMRYVSTTNSAGQRPGTYKEHCDCNLHLTLRTKDRDDVRGGLLIGEMDLGVRLRLNVMHENALLPEKSTMVLARDGDDLVDVVLVLPVVNQHHNSTLVDDYIPSDSRAPAQTASDCRGSSRSSQEF